MKEKVLDFLRQQPGFVSGQKICEELGVSRTAVWKCINSLKKEGYEIESVTRKGYRLLQSPDLLTEKEIASFLPEGFMQGKIHCFSSIDSTNEEAKRQAVAGAPDGSVYVADMQTRGKGRRGRVWISPAGEDVFFTFLLRPDVPLTCISMVTLVAALSVADAICAVTGETCQIKWPNDLVLHEKKVCGILTEMSAEIDHIDYVVVGIGINVNRQHFEEEIANMATSLRGETGKRIGRAALAARAFLEFEKNYKVFLREQSMKPFLERYNDRLINAGREVKIIKKDGEQICTALGINDKGELVVKHRDGKLENILSGEVSVRGIYGGDYV